MEALMEFIFPTRCAGCKRYDSIGFCVHCQSLLPSHPVFFYAQELEAGISIGPYEKPLREAILALKFEHQKVPGITLGELLGSRIQTIRWKLDGVIPVPMASKRWRERGFNHAHVLAENVARSLEVTCLDVLRVIRPIDHQVGLDRRERKRNVSNAFSLLEGTEIQGKTFLLVDDVVTTGATMSECASVLRKSGASKIYGAVAAIRPLEPKS